MKEIRYIKGDLFTAKRDSILAHAVNCQGVMGAGIARKFKIEFPMMFIEYQKTCFHYKNDFLGKCFLYPENGYLIANLATSKGFGNTVDSEEEILESTDKALADLFSSLNEMYLISNNICSNKFNSGLFNVPWEKTEQLLLKHLNKEENKIYNWIVFEVD